MSRQPARIPATIRAAAGLSDSEAAIRSLSTASSQWDPLVGYHTEAIGKEALGIEILRQVKPAVCLYLKRHDTVKPVDPHLLVICTVRHQIPPSAKQFDVIRLHLEGVGLSSVVAVICHCQSVALAHCLEYQSEIAIIGGFLFQQDTVFQLAVLHQQVALGDGSKIQRFIPPPAYLVFIGYIVSVTVLSVTLYHEAEHIKDAIAPLVEGAQRQFRPTAEVLVLLPFATDFLEGNPPRLIYGLRQPSVFVQNCCHSLYCKDVFAKIVIPCVKRGQRYWEIIHLPYLLCQRTFEIIGQM